MYKDESKTTMVRNRSIRLTVSDNWQDQTGTLPINYGSHRIQRCFEDSRHWQYSFVKTYGTRENQIYGTSVKKLAVIFLVFLAFATKHELEDLEDSLCRN